MGGIKDHMNGELTLLKREKMPVFNIKLNPKSEMIRIVPLGCLHVPLQTQKLHLPLVGLLFHQPPPE